MNISHDFDETKEKTIREPKQHDSKKITAYLKQHFGEFATYDKKEKTVYLCDNSLLSESAFIEFLKKWKVFVQPSLF